MNAPGPFKPLAAKVDERRQGRIPVALPGSVTVNDRVVSALIFDLAPGGALIEMPLAVLPGAKLSLRCGPIFRSATVNWKKGRRIGISFDQSLSDREVDEQIDRSHAIESRLHHQDIVRQSHTR